MWVQQGALMPIRDKVERTGDMHPNRSLHIYVQSDGDIVLIMRQNGACIGGTDMGNQNAEVAQVEFCLNGGRSIHTRRALYELIEAMKRDNAEHPIQLE
jgi:hypothetical protein